MGQNLSFTAFAWRSPATRINRSVLFICSVLWALWPTQAAFAATVPVSVSITDTPSAVQLGQPFSLNLNFDNTSTTDSGYGPYINLFLPSAGADGDDGYSFVNATYLGAPVTAIALPCPSGNSVSSPVTNLPVVCPTLPVGNNQWVILQLPFGSFAPNQTPAQIQVNIKTSNKADIGVALPIYAQGGFIYGTSATGNEPSSGSIVSTTVAPSLFTLSKSYVGPESETTTGPNYPRAFALQPSMPAGLTATNVLITDVLPNNIVYQGVTGTGFTAVQQPAIGSGPFNTPPNSNLLVLSMPSSLIGASQPITVNYYVTRTAANGSVVLGVTGTPSQTSNSATASANWSSIDPRDVSGVISASVSDVTHRDIPLALQKYIYNPTTPNSPSDLVTYTLNFQVSDFFTIGGIFITDTLPDGLEFVSGTMRLNAGDRNGNVSGAVPASAISMTPLITGANNLVVDMTRAFTMLGATDGILQGGLAIPPAAGAAQGTLTFQAYITDTYRATGLPVLPLDTINNVAQIASSVLSNTGPLSPALGSTSDNTIVESTVAKPSVAKNFYAINGSTTLPSPIKVSPKDDVTYILTYTLETGDFRNLIITDFLPQPLFDATSIASFISITSGLPAAGVAQWAPSMAVGGQLGRMGVPTLTTTALDNAVRFGFGSRSDPSNTPTQIALLFTVKASTRPFVDDLYMTNHVNTQQENSAGQTNSLNAVTTFRLAAPLLRLSKGIVSSSNPNAIFTQTALAPVTFSAAGTGSCANRFTGMLRSSDLITTPIDSNLRNADANDTVRFAIVVQNIGSALQGAFDTAVSDVLPANMGFVPGSLCIQSGSGALLGSSTPSTTLFTSFTSGVTLSVPISRGVDYLGIATSNGSDLAIISFDAVISTPITPIDILTNTAQIRNYANTLNGENLLPINPPRNPISDTARVSFSAPQFSKRFIDSELSDAYNSPSQVTIGELITYTLVLSIPEGTLPGAVVTDNLPAGLIFQACDSVSASSNVTATEGAINATNICDSVVSGSAPVFQLGTLVNSNNSDAITETLAITFRAVVLNLAANVTGTNLMNSATFNWQANQAISSNSVAVTIIRPNLNVAKEVTPRFGDSGDTLTYVITVSNPSANSTMAYDVVLTDVVPSGLTYVSSSWANVTGVAGMLNPLAAPTLIATWSTLAPGQSSVLSFDATVNNNVAPNLIITNTVQANITSLPGLTATQRSTYSANAVENNMLSQAAAAAVTVPPATLGKVLVGSEINSTNNASNRAVIGELVTYTLIITIPEGVTPNAVITDNLATGLAFAQFITYSASPALSFSVPITTLLTPVVTPASGATAGNRALWAIGTITNTNSNNAISETIQITYSTILLDVASNVSGGTRQNSAQFGWTGNATAVAKASNVTIIEPLMGASKSVSPAIGDAGDLITYTVVLTGPSGADEFDLTLRDNLPNNNGDSYILDPAIASVSTNSAPSLSVSNFNLSGSNSTGYTLTTAAPIDLAMNAARRITVVVTGTLATIVIPSAQLTNSVQITYTSLDDFAKPITRSSYNTTSTERNYTATASAVHRIIPLDAQKQLIGTSEDSTGTGSDGNPRVAVGEVVAYRLLIQLAEATAPTLTLDFKDNLPQDMLYVPGSARVAFVSNGIGITSSVLNTALAGCGGLNIAGSNPAAVPAISVTCPMPASQITYDANGLPTFAFGSVVNRDTDSDGEYVILQMSAVVKNVIGNQAGVLLTNTLDVLINGKFEDSSAPISVTVAEPAISVSKAVVPVTNIDAADTLTYTIIVRNGIGPNISSAFDVVITDVLPANLELLNASFSTSAPITSYTSAVNALLSDTQRITLTVGQLDPGSNVTVTLQARVLLPASNGTRLPNDAFVAYSSLPTTTGTLSNAIGVPTPGASGTITGERTSSGGVNDYVASVGVSVTLNTPRIEKLTPALTQYSIGDVITYSVLITVPEGVALNVSVLDDLPNGLGYVGYQLLTSNFNGTVLAPAVTQPSGDALFAFGNITNTADNDTSNNSFTLQVIARVLNSSVPLNQVGSGLSNRALLTYTNPISGVVQLNGGTVNVSVVEPWLQTSKQVSQSGAQAGDRLTYTVRVTNTGSAPAYDVTLTDALPASLRPSNSVACTINGVPIVCSLADGSPVTIAPVNMGDFDIPMNGVLVLTYTATVSDSIYINGSYANTVDADWSSRDGSDANERTYDDSTSYTVDDAQDTASANFSVGAPTFSKSDGGVTTTTVGSTIRYSLTLSSPLGTLRNLRVTDTLPVGLGYVANSASLSAGIAPQPVPSVIGQSIVWDFGNAVITPSNTIMIALDVIVLDDASNLKGANKTNTATLTYNNAANMAQIALNSSDSVQIVEPALQISKSVLASRVPVGAADVLTYVLAISNTGSAPAYSVNITDALPAGLVFVATQQIQVSHNVISTDSNASGTTQLAWQLSQLNPNATAQITFTTQVNAAIAANQTLINTTRTTYASALITSSRSYTSALATASVSTAAPVLDVLKTAPSSSEPVIAGELLTYTIRISSTGPVAGTGIVVTDRVPVSTTFVEAGPSAIYSNGTVSWTVGSLAADTGNAVVTVTVRVDEPLVNAEKIFNTAYLNNTNGGAITRTSSVTVPVSSAHMLILSKQVDPVIAQPGDSVTYTLHYTISGNEPAFGVTLTDELPSGLSYVDMGALNPSVVGQTAQWTLGTLSPTRARPIDGIITFTARLSNAPTLSGTQRINAARLSDAANLSSTARTTLTVNSAHALLISKSVMPAPATAGSLITYTLNYTLTGNEPAQFVEISDRLPLGTTFDTCSAGCVHAGGRARWALGNLSPGDSGSVELGLLINNNVLSGTLIVNTADISDTNQGATGTSAVSVSVIALADLVISKSDSSDPVAVQGLLGEESVLTYTLHYTNSGPSDAQNIGITDALPAGLRYGGTTQGPTPVRDGAIITWNVGSLASNASDMIIFTTTVIVGADEAILNTVGIATNTPESNLNNNTDSEETQIAFADVFITKDVQPKRVVLPGEVLTWTITFGNQGNLTATNVVFSDTATAGSVFGGILVQDAGLSGPTGMFPELHWAATQLMPRMQGQVVFTVTSGVATSLDVLLTNTVAITSSTPQTNTTNDADISVSPKIDLIAIKTVARSPVVEGETISFTIAVTNTGGFTLSTVPLTDTFDAAHLTYLNASNAPSAVGANELRWANLGPLAPRQSASVIVAFTANASTHGEWTTNQVTTTGEYSGTVLEPVFAAANLRITRASLSVRKFSASDNGLPVRPGDTLTYTIIISNAGDADAMVVNVRDALPDHTQFVEDSIDISPNLNEVNPGLLSALANGIRVNADDSVTITYQVVVNTPLPNGTLIVNSAEITSSSPVLTATDIVTDVIVSAHTLALSKQTQSAIVAPGDTLTYTLYYTLSGDEPVTGVILTDVLPAALNLLDAEPPASAQIGQSASWVLGDFSPTHAVPQVGMIVLTTTLSNAATVSGTQFTNNAQLTDAASLSARADATVTVNSGHALAVSKIASTETVTAGTTLTYTVFYTVSGNEPAHELSLRDMLPADATFVECGGCVESLGVLRWALGNKTPVANGQLTYTVKVPAHVLTGTLLVNAVQISDTNNGVTDTAMLTTPVVALADLAIAKQDVPDPVDVEGVLTYTLSYSNTGPSDAQGVIITDILPVGVIWGGLVQGPAPTQVGRVLTWIVGTVAAGMSNDILITVTIASDSPEQLSNGATIASSTHEENLSNNSASADTTVRYADVYILKSVSPTRPVIPGEVLTWTIRFGNAGNADAHNIFITDVLPAGALFGGVVSNGNTTGTLSVAQLSWFTPTLAAGASDEIVFTGTARIETSELVRIVNTVDITTSTPQTVTTNEHAEATTPKLDSAIQKTVARNPVVVGEWVSYTIEMTNTGGATLTGVPLTDTFDATYLRFESASLEPDTTTAGQLHWNNLGPLAEGAQTSVVVTFTALTSTQGGSTPNLATVQSEHNRTVLPEISSTADLRITLPSLSVRKFSDSEGGLPLRPGAIITYMIVISNAGDALASGVRVQDVLPSRVSFVAGSTQIEPTSTLVILGAPPTLVDALQVQADAQVTLTYQVVVDTPLDDGALIVNNVMISNSNGGVITATDMVTDVIVSAHTLVLEKHVQPKVAAPGEIITYTLSYTVSGNEAARNVTLSDTLPSGLSFIAAEPAPSVQDGNSQQWILGDLQPTANAPQQGVITLSARIDAGTLLSGTSFINTAVLTDAQKKRADATATVRIDSRHVLEVSKVADPITATAGTTLRYTIVYTISGNEPAQAVTLHDMLPAGTTLLNCDNSCENDGQNVVWHLGNILPLATGSMQVQVEVDTLVLSGTKLINTVSITDENGGLTNTATVTTPLIAVSDLSIRKQVDPAVRTAGDSVTYTLRFGNSGPSDARSVLVTDVLPSGLQFGGMIEGSAPDQQIGQTLIWDVGLLARNGSERRVFTATVDRDAPIQITNAVTIGNGSDLYLENNADLAMLAVQYSDVYVSKHVTPTRPVIPGEVLTWTIVYGNAGDALARDVVITDMLPAGADYGGIVSSDSALLATGTAPTLTWATPTLAAGTMGEIVFTTTAQVATSENVFIRNTVEITTSTPQTNTSNERATAITPKIDSSMSKTVWRNPIVVGELVSYTIEITNTGGAMLTTMPLTDTFNATHLDFMASAPAPSDIAPGQLRWGSVGPIDIGARAQVVVTFTARASTQGDTTLNVAHAHGEYGGTVLPEMSAQAAVRITQPRLSIQKQSRDDNGIPVRPGDRLNYTIVLRNEGDTVGLGLIMTDVLPAHMQLVAGSLRLDPASAGNLDEATLRVSDLTVLSASSVTLTYGVTVEGVLPNQTDLINTAYLTATGRDLLNGSIVTSTATVTDRITSEHGLALEKLAMPSVVSPGDVVTYSLIYTASGDELATNVVLTDVLPTQLESLACTGCTLIDAHTLRWALGNLTPPATGILTLTARVQENTLAETTLTNTARITDERGHSAEASTPIRIQDTRLDLSIQKRVQPSQVRFGDLVTYTLTVRNDGTKDIGQTYSIQAPGTTGGTIGPASPYPSVLHVSSLGQVTNVTVTLIGISHTYASDLDVLLVGPQGQAVMLMSDVGGIYEIDGLTLWFHDNAPALPDIDPLTAGVYRPTNYIANDGIETLPAPAPKPTYKTQLGAFNNTVANGDWQLFVADDQKNDSGMLIQGWALTLETTQGIQSFSTSSGALVSDLLPAGLQLISATTGYENANPVTWHANLPANSERVYTVVARVIITTPVLLNNTATISSEFLESTLANNSSTAVVQVLSPRASITATPPISYTPGTTLSIPVTITNNGTTTMTNAVVTITLPNGLTLTELPPGWREISPGVYGVPIGVIPPGGSVTIIIPVTVSPLLPPVFLLPIDVSVDDLDHPGESASSGTITAPVNRDVTLSVLKQGQPANQQMVRPGERITYTLLVSNTSGFTATNVVVRDALPDGVTWIGVASPVAQLEANTLAWRYAKLAPYQSIQMTFVVSVTRASEYESAILNQFTVSSNNTLLQTSNEVVNVYAPLAVTLSRFVGALQANGTVRLEWATSLEVNSFGFDIFRSPDGTRDSAVKITPTLIPAAGRAGGATYDFMDSAVQVGQTYAYWLVETELDGHQLDYGPVAVHVMQPGAQQNLYLPMLLRGM